MALLRRCRVGAWVVASVAAMACNGPRSAAPLGDVIGTNPDAGRLDAGATGPGAGNGGQPASGGTGNGGTGNGGTGNGGTGNGGTGNGGATVLDGGVAPDAGADGSVATDAGAGGSGSGEELLFGTVTGPLVRGSTVDVSPIDAAGTPTGVVFSTPTDAIGKYAVRFTYEGPIQIDATGGWYDELSGTVDTTPLSLYALSTVNAPGATQVNVNASTHFTYLRAKNLIAGGAPVAAASRKRSASSEPASTSAMRGLRPARARLWTPSARTTRGPPTRSR